MKYFKTVCSSLTAARVMAHRLKYIGYRGVEYTPLDKVFQISVPLEKSEDAQARDLAKFFPEWGFELAG